MSHRPSTTAGTIWKAISAALALVIALAFYAAMIPGKAGAVVYTPKRSGELDCNGNSPSQLPVKRTMLCTDVRGFANVRNAYNWNDRAFDNGVYLGHDEPAIAFWSSAPGSGNDVTWNETLSTDPTALPTVANKPGRGVIHNFELTPAPWFGMAICDPHSYPQLPCTPDSDSNVASGNYPGAGSAFMELQFYPPGFAPFADAISCDNTHWCAALNIDSYSCTDLFATCNPSCQEPVNFAFVQRNGVPPGPPSPQLADAQTFLPNRETLLMNPGDDIKTHIYDAPVPNSSPPADALMVQIKDLTTGQSGRMQASAANGFADTSMVDCTGIPFNFEPEYATATPGNDVPWAALASNIATEFETGHFEPCRGVNPNETLSVPLGTVLDTLYTTCIGPYENSAPGADGPEHPEVSDAPCFQYGDTHHGYAQPDEVTGCLAAYFQNGDLDFDGTPYWPDWPKSLTATNVPSSFVQQEPTTTSGTAYSSFQFMTDIALSESTCSVSTPAGCAVPPPNAPGGFYPYWTLADSSGTCTWEFGNMARAGPGRQSFNRQAQYGTNQQSVLGYPLFESALHTNSCPAPPGSPPR